MTTYKTKYYRREEQNIDALLKAYNTIRSELVMSYYGGSEEYSVLIKYLNSINASYSVITAREINLKLENAVNSLLSKIKSNMASNALASSALAPTPAFISPPGFGKTHGIEHTLKTLKQKGVIVDYVAHDMMGHNPLTAPFGVTTILTKTEYADFDVTKMNDLNKISEIFDYRLVNIMKAASLKNKKNIAENLLLNTKTKQEVNAINTIIAKGNLREIFFMIREVLADSAKYKDNETYYVSLLRYVYHIFEYVARALYYYVKNVFDNVSTSIRAKRVELNDNHIIGFLAAYFMYVCYYYANSVISYSSALDSFSFAYLVAISALVGEFATNLDNNKEAIGYFYREILGVKKESKDFENIIKKKISTVFSGAVREDKIGFSNSIAMFTMKPLVMSHKQQASSEDNFYTFIAKVFAKLDSGYQEMYESITQASYLSKIKDFIHSMDEKVKDGFKKSYIFPTEEHNHEGFVLGISNYILSKGEVATTESFSNNKIDEKDEIYVSIEDYNNKSKIGHRKYSNSIDGDYFGLAYNKYIDFYTKESMDILRFYSYILSNMFNSIYDKGEDSDLFAGIARCMGFYTSLVVQDIDNVSEFVDIDQTVKMNYMLMSGQKVEYNKDNLITVFPKKVNDLIETAMRDYERASSSGTVPGIYVAFLDEFFHMFSGDNAQIVATLWDGLANRKDKFPPNFLLVLAGNAPTRELMGKLSGETGKLLISRDSMQAFFARVSLNIVIPDLVYITDKVFPEVLRDIRKEDLGIKLDNEYRLRLLDSQEINKIQELKNFFIFAQPQNYNFYKAVYLPRLQALSGRFMNQRALDGGEAANAIAKILDEDNIYYATQIIALISGVYTMDDILESRKDQGEDSPRSIFVELLRKHYDTLEKYKIEHSKLLDKNSLMSQDVVDFVKFAYAFYSSVKMFRNAQVASYFLPLSFIAALFDIADIGLFFTDQILLNFSQFTFSNQEPEEVENVRLRIPRFIFGNSVRENKFYSIINYMLKENVDINNIADNAGANPNLIVGILYLSLVALKYVTSLYSADLEYVRNIATFFDSIFVSTATQGLATIAPLITTEEYNNARVVSGIPSQAYTTRFDGVPVKISLVDKNDIHVAILNQKDKYLAFSKTIENLLPDDYYFVVNIGAGINHEEKELIVKAAFVVFNLLIRNFAKERSSDVFEAIINAIKYAKMLNVFKRSQRDITTYLANARLNLDGYYMSIVKYLYLYNMFLEEYHADYNSDKKEAIKLIVEDLKTAMPLVLGSPEHIGPWYIIAPQLSLEKYTENLYHYSTRELYNIIFRNGTGTEKLPLKHQGVDINEYILGDKNFTYNALDLLNNSPNKFAHLLSLMPLMSKSSGDVESTAVYLFKEYVYRIFGVSNIDIYDIDSFYNTYYEHFSKLIGNNYVKEVLKIQDCYFVKNIKESVMTLGIADSREIRTFGEIDTLEKNSAFKIAKKYLNRLIQISGRNKFVSDKLIAIHNIISDEDKFTAVYNDFIYKLKSIFGGSDSKNNSCFVDHILGASILSYIFVKYMYDLRNTLSDTEILEQNQDTYQTKDSYLSLVCMLIHETFDKTLDTSVIEDQVRSAIENNQMEILTKTWYSKVIEVIKHALSTTLRDQNLVESYIEKFINYFSDFTLIDAIKTIFSIIINREQSNDVVSILGIGESSYKELRYLTMILLQSGLSGLITYLLKDEADKKNASLKFSMLIILSILITIYERNVNDIPKLRSIFTYDFIENILMYMTEIYSLSSLSIYRTGFSEVQGVAGQTEYNKITFFKTHEDVNQKLIRLPSAIYHTGNELSENSKIVIFYDIIPHCEYRENIGFEICKTGSFVELAGDSVEEIENILKLMSSENHYVFPFFSNSLELLYFSLSYLLQTKGASGMNDIISFTKMINRAIILSYTFETYDLEKIQQILSNVTPTETTELENILKRKTPHPNILAYILEMNSKGKTSQKAISMLNYYKERANDFGILPINSYYQGVSSDASSAGMHYSAVINFLVGYHQTNYAAIMKAIDEKSETKKVLSRRQNTGFSNAGEKSRYTVMPQLANILEVYFQINET
ncbi:MAG: hypothetical protein QW255_04815 [Candidatus Bilamarchaeaceae archaeon]